ncbi:hypothetical protein [Marinobacterium jannaschii]|uniref:hypothetical protein n=1 Tax=Marinobacterium jannaschii TaxID=64970 RepID=UPI00056573BE|nr:hypothetical protein [Marinobacterium jannaschii]
MKGKGVAGELLMEIVELESGEFAIRPSGEDGEPVIRVAFSDALKDQLGDGGTEISRVMLTAGIQLVAEAGHEIQAPAPAPRPVIH